MNRNIRPKRILCIFCIAVLLVLPASAAEKEEKTTGWDVSEWFTSDALLLGQDVADFACQFVGNPYVWGGISLTRGADCSGFVMSVYANFEMELPHYAASQAGYGTEVGYADLIPGDLVFYSSGWGINHVAIYIGDGQIVHAENAAKGICISPVDFQPIRTCRRLL